MILFTSKLSGTIPVFDCYARVRVERTRRNEARVASAFCSKQKEPGKTRGDAINDQKTASSHANLYFLEYN